MCRQRFSVLNIYLVLLSVSINTAYNECRYPFTIKPLFNISICVGEVVFFYSINFHVTSVSNIIILWGYET